MNNYNQNNSNYNSSVNDFYSFSNNDSYNNSYNQPYNGMNSTASLNPLDNTTNQQKVVSRSFAIMFAVLLISGITALISAGSIEGIIRHNIGLFYGALIAEVVVVLIANAAMSCRNEGLSAIMLLVYSIVNGFTLSIVFVVYELGSIVSIFFIAAAMFGVLGFIGITTKKDLSVLGSVGIMLLTGIILASVVNMFAGSARLDFGLTVLGLAVFIGLTMYDFQKIKRLGATCSDRDVNTFAMFGALQLYLDFINIFLKLLRLFANRKN